MEKINTYGFDLVKILEEAKEKNPDFATVIENSIYNLQKVYDVVAEKHTATGDEDYWNIDAEYVKNLLK